MKKETRKLLAKSVNSLILTIEHFNRPIDRGRTESVLIFLDHSFEMLLKASILQRGGKIRQKRERETLGFDACVRKALSDGEIKFISKEQAMTLQLINGLRDAAQHYLLDIPESQLYIHSQAGLTLYADILKKVFGFHLHERLPERVLPLSTKAPVQLSLMIEDEIKTVKNLLRPGIRRKTEARLRIKSLAIMERTIKGQKTQPSMGELNKILGHVKEGQDWNYIFPHIASLELDTTGKGIPFSLHITKKKGVPIHLVPEGTPGARVVAIKRVDELGFYSLGLNQLAQKVSLTAPKALSVIRYLGIQENPDFFKKFRIGRTEHKRYSIEAVKIIKRKLPKINLDKVWSEHGPKRRAG